MGMITNMTGYLKLLFVLSIMCASVQVSSADNDTDVTITNVPTSMPTVAPNNSTGDVTAAPNNSTGDPTSSATTTVKGSFLFLTSAVALMNLANLMIKSVFFLSPISSATTAVQGSFLLKTSAVAWLNSQLLQLM